MTTDDVIDRLAATQHGVVRRTHLLAAGLSRHAIQHRVDAGRLRRLHAAFTPCAATGTR